MSFVRKYNEDTKVWLMSDLHLGHDRDFLWAKRGFSNVQEHNETILNNIKTCVGENDEFYILGDLTLGNLDAAAPLLAKIPGHVHVILGNHDTERRIEFYESFLGLKHSTRAARKGGQILNQRPLLTHKKGRKFNMRATLG